VTAAGATADNVVLAFSTPVSANNKDCFNFVICTNLPSTPAPIPVLVTVNGDNIPLLNMYGNPVYSNELRKRKMYYGFFGSQTTAHIIVRNLGDCCCG
jgi:hypothetical protein